jgi:hypothetical protein
MNDLSRVTKITGPLLVFGGPYGNLEATAAILAEARRRAIPFGHILCTGDLAAYCADPQAVIDLVRGAQVHVATGNCEESLADRAADCGCGFAEDSACTALSNEWYAFADRNIDAESRIWMGSLPPRIDIEINGRRLAALHGSVTSINRFRAARGREGCERDNVRYHRYHRPRVRLFHPSHIPGAYPSPGPDNLCG